MRKLIFFILPNLPKRCFQLFEIYSSNESDDTEQSSSLLQLVCPYIQRFRRTGNIVSSFFLIFRTTLAIIRDLLEKKE